MVALGPTRQEAEGGFQATAKKTQPAVAAVPKEPSLLPTQGSLRVARTFPSTISQVIPVLADTLTFTCMTP